MSSPGLTRGIRKGFRTVVQVAAGGALTALVTALAGGMAPSTQAIVMGAWIAFVAFSQNWAEGAGKVPVLLPTPSLVVGPATEAVATVEAVADAAGKVTGAVVETGGGIVGRVTGLLRRGKKGPGVLGDDTRLPDDGGIPLALIILIVVGVLVLGGLFTSCDALFTDEDERNDLGLPALVAHHDYDGGEDWNNEDYNRNRNRNRGAFSPGPFDDSPVDAFNGNVVCLPGSTCYADRGDQPPDERQQP